MKKKTFASVYGCDLSRLLPLREIMLFIFESCYKLKKVHRGEKFESSCSARADRHTG